MKKRASGRPILVDYATREQAALKAQLVHGAVTLGTQIPLGDGVGNAERKDELVLPKEGAAVKVQTRALDDVVAVRPLGQAFCFAGHLRNGRGDRDARLSTACAMRCPEPAPLVSIVIPTKDHVETLDACVMSIAQKATYANYEIVLVENNQRSPGDVCVLRNPAGARGCSIRRQGRRARCVLAGRV